MTDATDNKDDDHQGLLFEHSPVPMFIVPPDVSRFLHVNEAALRLLGRSRAEVHSGSPADFTLPSEVRRLEETAARGGEGLIDAGQFTVVRPDGTRIEIEAAYGTSRFKGQDALIVSAVDISSRVAAQRRLAKSEETFRVGFDEASTPTTLLDGDGRFIRVNRAFLALFRVSADEVLGRSPAELTHPDDLARDDALKADIAAGRRDRVELEKRYVRPDGSVIFAKASGIVLERREGRPTLIMTEIEDRTALHETMHALRNVQRRLEVALETSSDGFYDADFETGGILMSERAERILGYSGADIPKTIADWAALVHPTDMQRAWDQLAAHARGERASFEIELRMRRRDGTWAWILDRAKIAERFPDGGIRRLIGTLTDVGERRAAAETIARQAEVFDTLLSNIPILIVFIRPDGTFEYVNRTFERTLGWSLESMAGEDMMAHFYPEPGHRADVARFMASGDLHWRDFHIRTRDGRDILTAWTNVHLVDGRMIGIGEDVTARRLAEEERRGLEQQLLQAQKLESLGVLAGGIAHDFNNLLVGILGNASLAEELLPPSNPATPLVGEMRSAATRAAELTRQLLAYAGKGRFVIERLQLSRLGEEMATLLRAVISKNSTLRCEFAPGLPDVEGDATQLRQIVMNLITNASEALDDRPGTVTLRTGLMEVDEDFLRECVGDPQLRVGRAAFFEVEDTGRGMDRATLERIFDPFFTTKFTGRGLGLAAALGIIRSHRGAIRVRSSVGAGTVIRCALPVVTASAAARLPVAEGAPGALVARPRGAVLLADDEGGVRTVAKRGLERLGFEVVEAVDGREALKLFSAEPERWCFAMLDVTMPNLSGDDALRAMRELRAELPAVLYSGYSVETLDKALMAQCRTRFLQKPFTIAQLGDAVKDALAPVETA